MSSAHIPVLLGEVLESLSPLAGATVLDGTFGAGGYTRAILEHGAAGVIAIDRDPTAIEAGQALVEATGGRLRLVHSTFGVLDQVAEKAGTPQLDGVVLDIGVSSMQLDRAERGFSFRFDGPLDMRMAMEGPSAADLVNELEIKELAMIFTAYGEERHSMKIAHMIADRRKEKPFETTQDLATLCETAYGFRKPGEIHPATRAFQALRIAVNRELDELVEALAAAERALKPGGRLVVVTFHSLEDRIVKRFFADRSRTRGGGSRHMMEVEVPPATFTMAGKGLLEASDGEIAANPRSRSAKLRFGLRTQAPAREIDAEALGLPNIAPKRKGRR